MKTLNWVFAVLILCLSLLPGLCRAEDLTSLSSEASIPNSLLDEAIWLAVAIIPLENSDALASPLSIPEISIPVSQNKGFTQVAVANIPPKAAKAEEPVSMIADPLEPINRAFFQFNDKLYFWVLKPAASGYKVIFPEVVRVSVRNFFSNVTTPIRLVNCLLQGNFKCGGTETLRFLVNTTLGIAGFFDPAKKEFNIEKKDKDFGLTLGVYGMGSIFYIVLPILGPSSLRDAVGYLGDLSLDPLTYLPISTWIKIGVKTYDQVNETSLRIGEYEDLKESAIDPYIALKDAYHQYRENKIRGR
jgi:phospholipid-binding lipoprotein MlaA